MQFFFSIIIMAIIAWGQSFTVWDSYNVLFLVGYALFQIHLVFFVGVRSQEKMGILLQSF